MADALTADELDTADELEIADELQPESGQALQRRGRGLFRGRFLVAYAVLGLALAGAVVGLVVLVARPGAEPDPPWSNWQPEGDDGTKAQQIADHVGGRYRLENGEQLVAVQAAPLRVQDIPIGAIAVREPPSVAGGEPPIAVLSAESAVAYILCGLGENCSIEEGTPSTDRLRLLRRESLELALYTFSYVEKDTVVAFLPPPPGESPSLALLFERSDLQTELAAPLRLTVPQSAPPQPDAIPPTEVVTIDRLTSPGLFSFEFQQLQDGTAVLVLTDPALAAQEEEAQGNAGAQGTTTGE